MVVVYYIILASYSLVLIYITIYCLIQFQLLYHYQKSHSNKESGTILNLPIPVGDLPLVTVQLPIYNERYVVERLIDSVCNFDYPKERLEIQILDDSTDDTVELVRKKVAEYRKKGFNIEQIKRSRRKGFKAGALREATNRAHGEFLAIFDADFLPRRDFLQRTIPYFDDSSTGVVQTRWEHINRDYSLLTKLQALQLNVHFTVEQQGRKAANQMLQFNGTAGVWRKKAIDDAGGWEEDTLTEDLDLSIRAQLKGWKIQYLEEIGSPAELPAEMSGFKSQQFRWMKGGAETAKKMLPTVWRSSLPVGKKLHSTFHLLSSTVFVFVFMLGVLSVPLLIALKGLDLSTNIFSIFIVGTISIVCVYYMANIANRFTNPHKSFWRDLFKFAFMFPVFLAMSMGLSLHNTVAVLQGYRGKRSEFVRTPKFNIKDFSDNFKKSTYRSNKIKWTTIIEGLLCLYFIFAVFLGYRIGDKSFVLFHILLAIGYGSIFYYTIKHVSAK
ncbi:MAG: glycosyltransferase [Saprospiraceae bacterium]|nr:glycosyltransferase [Saprospiraceae bacterium]